MELETAQVIAHGPAPLTHVLVIAAASLACLLLAIWAFSIRPAILRLIGIPLVLLGLLLGLAVVSLALQPQFGVLLPGFPAGALSHDPGHAYVLTPAADALALFTWYLFSFFGAVRLRRLLLRREPITHVPTPQPAAGGTAPPPPEAS